MKSVRGPEDRFGGDPEAVRRPLAVEVGFVRLTKHKIQYLADKILKMIQDHPRIHPEANVDLVIRAIEDAIAGNMEIEDEIDAEVEVIVSQNRHEIRAMEMDVGALRNKIKRELARKRGFTL